MGRRKFRTEHLAVVLRERTLSAILLRMKDEILSRARRIANARAAAAFSDPLRHRLLLMFAGRERTLSEVAGATGLDLKRLHYHVTAMRNLGLLAVTRRERRAGRPIKFYRAVADAFFVPTALAPAPVHAGLDRELRDALAHLRDRTGEGTLYYAGEDGGPRMRLVRSAATVGAAYTEQWRMLRLSRADAARLIAGIDALLKSFVPSGANGDSYLLHFAMAPTRTKRQ